MSKRRRTSADAGPRAKKSRPEPPWKIGELLATAFDPLVHVMPRELDMVDILCLSRVNMALWKALSIERHVLHFATHDQWLAVWHQVMTVGGKSYERAAIVLVESWSICVKTARCFDHPDSLGVQTSKHFWSGLRRGLSATLLHRYCELLMIMGVPIAANLNATALNAFKGIIKAGLPMERICELFTVHRWLDQGPSTNMAIAVLKEVNDAATPSFLYRLLSVLPVHYLLHELIIDPDVTVSLLQSVLRVVVHSETLDEIRLDDLFSISVDKFTWVIRHLPLR